MPWKALGVTVYAAFVVAGEVSLAPVPNGDVAGWTCVLIDVGRFARGGVSTIGSAAALPKPSTLALGSRCFGVDDVGFAAVNEKVAPNFFSDCYPNF